MNAYELAKLLDFDAETLNWKAFADAANMLRQQADQLAKADSRIAELEKKLHTYKNKYKYNDLVNFVQDATAKAIKEERHGIK